MNKKAILFCKRHNLPYTVQPLKYGYERIEVQCANYAEMEAVRSAAARKFAVDQHTYSMTVYIYDREDDAELKRILSEERKIVNLFWEARHEGKTQEEAHRIQYDYAITNNNAMKAYNFIYA